MRPFKIDDVELMQQLDADPEVVRYLGDGLVRSPDKSRANLQKILNDYREHGLGLFAVYDKQNEFVGRSGLIPWVFEEALTWEIGYSFKQQAWGKGYATEVARALANWARENLDVPHVISLIHPQNAASIHVARKTGMEFWKNTKIQNLELSVFQLLIRD